MAISRTTLAGIGLATFGASLLLASGPLGVAFGLACLYSVLAAATFASLIHLAAGSNVTVGFWPSIYRPFTGLWPTHSRTFVPGGIHRPTHTSTFVPGGVRTPTAPSHTRTFVPGGAARTFTPARTHAAAPSHTRTFVPSAPSFAPTHTRTFIPRR